MCSDPHNLCARCRGGKCSFQGKTCDFCSGWTEEFWKNLKPVGRPYASRNPLSRSKKPGKPSKLQQLLLQSQGTILSVDGEASLPSVNAINNQSNFNKEDDFVGFHTTVSPSQPKLDIFNRPMVVRDYEALPNDKFKVVHGLINKIQPERRKFINVVYSRITNCFSIVPHNTSSSKLSYEEFMRGSGASSLLPESCAIKQKKMKRSASESGNVPKVAKCARITTNKSPNTSARRDSAPFPILRADAKLVSPIPASQPDKVDTPTCSDLFTQEAQSSKGESTFLGHNKTNIAPDYVEPNKSNENMNVLHSKAMTARPNLAQVVVPNPNIAHAQTQAILSHCNTMTAKRDWPQTNWQAQRSLAKPVRTPRKIAKPGQSNGSELNYDKATPLISSPGLPLNRTAIVATANISPANYRSTNFVADGQGLYDSNPERVSNFFSSRTANDNVTANVPTGNRQNNDPILTSTIVHEDVNYDIFVDNKGNEFVSADKVMSYKMIDASGRVLASQSDSMFIINQGVSCSAPIVSNDIITSDSIVVSASKGNTNNFIRTVPSGGRPITSVIKSENVVDNTKCIKMTSSNDAGRNEDHNLNVVRSSEMNIPAEDRNQYYNEVIEHSQVTPSCEPGVSEEVNVESRWKDRWDMIQTDMSTLASSIVETREKFDDKLENSISALSSRMSDNFDKIFEKLKSIEENSKDNSIPITPLDDENEEEQENHQNPTPGEDEVPPPEDNPLQFPKSPIYLRDLLEVPNPEFWNGLVYDGYLYFVDFVGFGWKVLLSSDEFFLTGLVYDISSLQHIPRSKNILVVLNRIRFENLNRELYKMTSVGEGLVTVHPAGNSDRVVKVLSPWSLPVFEVLPKSPIEHTPNQDQNPDPNIPIQQTPDPKNPSPEEEAKRLGKIPRFLIETVSAAKQKALDENDSTKASIFQSLLEAIDPVDSPEGSERNWPLIIKTIKERFPEAIKQLSFWDPGTTSKSTKSDLVFEENEFFSQGLGWLHLVAKGEASATGKECHNESPLSLGKWLPNTVSRMRRFYRHGTKDHVCIFPSPKAKNLLPLEARDSFEVTPTQVPPSFLKSVAENVSLLREIISTTLHLQNVMRSEDNFSSLSSVFKASSVSTLLALKDAMTVSSQIQANLMLLQRDRFLMKMSPKLLNSRQNVIEDIRTAPFDGPLISDSLADSFKDIPATQSQGTSFSNQVRPRSFFRGVRRGRPTFPTSQRRVSRSPMQSGRRTNSNSQRLPQSSQRGNFTRTGRQRPRRSGSRGAFFRK